MPRRPSARASNPQASPHPTHPENMLLLRSQWRWAAFSQFFHTFSPIFAMGDITISDIENDLVYYTNKTLSRIMQKLLYTLSYDRKVSVDNWQSALRKQYYKRNPGGNPIGPELREPIQHTEDHEKEQETPISEPVDPPLEECEGKQSSESTFLASREISDSANPGNENGSLSWDAGGSRQSSVAQRVPVSDDGLNIGGEIGEGAEQEDSMDWFDLPMLTKLESMHTLAEWHFQNPTRLRTIMRSDDDLASWRIEPIGYDSKRNAFWLIGGQRLWIQRAAPKPSKSQSSKRKRPSDNTLKKSHPISKINPAPKRPRLDVVNPHSSSSDKVPFLSKRHSRAAKDKAKSKLDLQAKEFAKLNHEAIHNHQTKFPHTSSPKTQTSRRVFGTRTSARLRGTQEDEWQPIPHEWLETDPKSRRATPMAQKTGLESDQETISDLTELSEEDESKPQSSHTPVDEGDSTRTFNDLQTKQIQETPNSFTEWETLCVTLQEWENVAEQFEKAAHYSEKALYKLLVNDIVPTITQELREIERKRELEEAVVHRKRSSRIALRESEREETRLAAKQKQEAQDKFSRARRMEVRLQKEETERIKRENAREQRRKEREAREETRKVPVVRQETVDDKARSCTNDVDSLSVDDMHEERANGKSSNSGSRTPAGEDWELSCEICQRQGINLDDGTPMMSCGRCSKWQHIICHDREDKATGRPPRNWDFVDFICKKCRNPRQDHVVDRFYAPVQHLHLHPSQIQQVYHSYQPPMVPTVDSRHSHHSPAVKEAQQSFYARPPNGQHSNIGQYAIGAPANGPRPTISFSHYQPAAHGFSGTQKVYADPQSYHGHRHQNPQYRAASSPSYKSQTTIPAWNITTPTYAHPGYVLPHNGASSASSSAPNRNLPDDRQAIVQSNEPSQSLYRYPDQHYTSTQFKHHPTSYQPPLGR